MDSLSDRSGKDFDVWWESQEMVRFRMSLVWSEVDVGGEKTV